MLPALARLERLEDLDALLARSADRPVLIYKHSAACGTSACALDELVELVRGPARDVEYAMVTVQTHRAVSGEVARRLGVRHETPQVILVREGRPVWSASHFRVTTAAIERALAAHGDAAPLSAR